jgi:hypothetical protein
MTYAETGSNNFVDAAPMPRVDDEHTGSIQAQVHGAIDGSSRAFIAALGRDVADVSAAKPTVERPNAVRNALEAAGHLLDVGSEVLADAEWRKVVTSDAYLAGETSESVALSKDRRELADRLRKYARRSGDELDGIQKIEGTLLGWEHRVLHDAFEGRTVPQPLTAIERADAIVAILKAANDDGVERAQSAADALRSRVLSFREVVAEDPALLAVFDQHFAGIVEPPTPVVREVVPVQEKTKTGEVFLRRLRQSLSTGALTLLGMKPKRTDVTLDRAA